MHDDKVANIQGAIQRPLDSQIIVHVLLVVFTGIPVLLDAAALADADASHQPVPIHRIFELAPLLLFVFTVGHFLRRIVLPGA